MFYTSQIHTSNTEAATSYAVSPQLFRTKGAALCLDKRYTTTGRCPLEAAFTMKDVSRSSGDENLKRPTKWCPTTLIAKVDATYTVYFSCSTAAFTEPSYNIKVTLERG